MSLPVKQPISLWNKPLAAEWKGLFKSLSSAIGHGVTGQWTRLATDAAGVVTSMGLDTSPDGRAWLLVRRALVRAVFELVGEHRDRLTESAAPGDLPAQLDALLEAAALEITPRFLDHPGELSILDTVAPLLGEWLCAWGASEADARVIGARLRSYFVHALVVEWRENEAAYRPILAALDTPFAGASARELAWRENAARLRRQVNAPMFGESFGLAQVYIRQRYAACAPERARSMDDLQPGAGAQAGAWADRWIVVELMASVRAWLDAMNPGDAIRVLSGGPGSGKSSFARMLASELAAEHARVVLIPLFDLDLEDSLPAAVNAYVRRMGLELQGLLDPGRGEPRLILVFDGLDELSVRGKLGTDAALELVRQVERAVRDMNQGGCRLQVLITGRELAVQATERDLREPGQILRLLPYYVPPRERERERYQDPDGLLAHDQRDTWWARYGWAAGLEVGSMPEALRRRDLEEITSEPLLCYLVALGYRGQRIDFAREDVDLNAIYQDLLHSVYERGYEGRRRHKTIRHLSVAQFVEVLEEIGLAAWHGAGRTATLGAIRDYCQRNPRLARAIEQFEKDAEAGVTGLLLAFYFRQGGTTEIGDRTFELTHKSFGEYLTARRIVRALERMARRVGAGDGGDEDGWTEADALAYWADVCGPAALDLHILRFLRGEVRRRADAAGRWQRVLARLIGRMLRAGMPMERLARRPFCQELEQARHAEVALFALLDACSRVTGQRSEIDWPSATSFGAWLRSVQGQRAAHEIPLIHDCLSRLDLTEVILMGSDLFLANLRGVHLCRANLSNACLRFADMAGANLAGADLPGAHLQRANLHEARLPHARLSDAKLEAAELIGADLAFCALPRVSLVHADLTDSNLHGVYASDADLTRADLERANLQDANLERAVLRDADLGGANLRGANLSGTDLRGARLRETDLRGARYSEETLWPVDFDPASIEEADMPHPPFSR